MLLGVNREGLIRPVRGLHRQRAAMWKSASSQRWSCVATWRLRYSALLKHLRAETMLGGMLVCKEPLR